MIQLIAARKASLMPSHIPDGGALDLAGDAAEETDDAFQAFVTALAALLAAVLTHVQAAEAPFLTAAQAVDGGPLHDVERRHDGARDFPEIADQPDQRARLMIAHARQRADEPFESGLDAADERPTAVSRRRTAASTMLRKVSHFL